MFEDEEVLLAWFGGLTGVKARKAVKGAKAIAQGKEDLQYFSYFIANADTGLELSEEFPESIRSFNFTFGSTHSTSGRLMPQYFIEHLSADKLPIDEFFTRGYAFSGDHDATCELVESGKAQVGVVSYKTYDKRVEDGETDPIIAKVIWKTPFYADYNFSIHPKVDLIYGERFSKAIQKALVDIEDPGLLAAFPRKALIKANNGHFKKIKTLAMRLDLVD